MAQDLSCTREVAEIAAQVFELIRVIEKVSKREGPNRALVLLGFLFNSTTRVLSIPVEKLRALLAMIDDFLARAEAMQSISWTEFQNLIGKLTWAATGVELGRTYLSNMRKLGTAVLSTLERRSERQAFCIQLYLFPRALAELCWWCRALLCNRSECSGTLAFEALTR